MEHLLVVSNMYPSPERPFFGVFVKRQVDAIERMGVRCQVVASSRAGGSMGASVEKYGELGRRTWTAARSKPRAILAHFVFPSGAIALAARRRARAPVAVVAHGGDVDPDADRPAWARRATKEVLRRADLLVAVSRSIAEEAHALGASRDRTVVAAMGYDADAFVPRSRAESRKRLGLDPDETLAVYVGNLIERKGVAEIVAAADLLRESQPNVRWILVGDGNPARWNAGDRVRFAGPADPTEVPWWLAAADIAVVPSRREPYGVAAVEAMACGIPVVASNSGGLAEIIRDEETGLLIPPRDPKALAAAVERLASDDALRTRLGAAGPAEAGPHAATRQAKVLLDALENATVRRATDATGRARP